MASERRLTKVLQDEATTEDLTHLVLAISASRGGFESLMPRPEERPGDRHGRPPGRTGPAPFTAMCASGGPGVGRLDLTIMGMEFVGTVEHGGIRIGT